MMGSQLLRQIEAWAMAGRLSDISHSARMCLFVIAFNAHDTGTNDAPSRTYFRGWEHLARVALGRSTYDAAAERAVARAIAELVDAGFIKPVGRRNAARHGHVMYELVY